MSRQKNGTYFGVIVDRDGYFDIFPRQQETLFIAGHCVGGDELSAVVDEMIRDLERLKKWAVRYSRSDRYQQDRIVAWTRG